MKYSRKRNQFLIFFVDLFILFISLYLALSVRNFSFPSLSSYFYHVKAFLLIWAVFVISMYTFNLYSLDVPFTELRLPLKVFVCVIIATLFGIISFYVFRLMALQPKTILLLDIIFSYFLILGWRYYFDYLSKKSKRQIKYVIVGYNETIHELIKTSLKNNYLNFYPVAIFSQQENIPNDVTSAVKIIIF